MSPFLPVPTGPEKCNPRKAKDDAAAEVDAEATKELSRRQFAKASAILADFNTNEKLVDAQFM